MLGREVWEYGPISKGCSCAGRRSAAPDVRFTKGRDERIRRLDRGKSASWEGNSRNRRTAHEKASVRHLELITKREQRIWKENSSSGNRVGSDSLKKKLKGKDWGSGNEAGSQVGMGLTIRSTIGTSRL